MKWIRRGVQPHVNRDRLGPALAYCMMVMTAVGCFLLIRSCGDMLGAAPGEPADAARPDRIGHAGNLVLHVLLALTVVVASGVAGGKVFGLLRQPAVLGEVVAGILLGPSFFGWLAPNAWAFVLPGTVMPFLGIVGQLGVILYIFLVGLDFNPALLRERAHATVATSHASIIVPFLLGATLALGLYARLSSRDVSFTSFALFLGVSMAITAFPVLARILTDLGMHKSRLGAIALACAATDDVTAWCLLTFVVGVAQAELGRVLAVSAMSLGYIVFVYVAVRPIVVRRLGSLQEAQLTRWVIGIVLVALLLSALTTELIGIHAILGAFLFGAVIPHGSALARSLRQRLEDVVGVLLLPAFFAVTGLRTRVELVAGWEQWLVCGLIILVATAGKFGGTLVAARITGLTWREGAALGILMNTRGLMELIVLNIGLDLGVISPTLFAMMVIMALATTFATTPVLQMLGLGPRSDRTRRVSSNVPVEEGLSDRESVRILG